MIIIFKVNFSQSVFWCNRCDNLKNTKISVLKYDDIFQHDGKFDKINLLSYRLVHFCRQLFLTKKILVRLLHTTKAKPSHLCKHFETCSLHPCKRHV